MIFITLNMLKENGEYYLRIYIEKDGGEFIK